MEGFKEVHKGPTAESGEKGWDAALEKQVEGWLV